MNEQITHETIAANSWAFLAEDVMIRVAAYLAEEERTMRECMSNRDNYDLDEIRAVIAHWDRCGSDRRANIARAILAERLAEAAYLEQKDAEDWEREQAHVRRAENGGQILDIYAGLPNEDGIDENGQNVFLPGPV